MLTRNKVTKNVLLADGETTERRRRKLAQTQETGKQVNRLCELSNDDADNTTKLKHYYILQYICMYTCTRVHSMQYALGSTT